MNFKMQLMPVHLQVLLNYTLIMANPLTQTQTKLVLTLRLPTLVSNLR
jgi:hypothetical protein